MSPRFIPTLADEKILFCDWNWVDPGYGQKWNRHRDEIYSEFEAKNLQILPIPPSISKHPLIIHEYPWEADFFGPYTTVIAIDGWWYLYYECFPSHDGKVRDRDALLCLARSKDGRKWTKPMLDLFSWDDEFPETNIIYQPSADASNHGAHGAHVFEDPLADHDERYKLVHEGMDNTVRVLASPDGIHWHPFNDGIPIIRAHSDSHDSIHFDPYLGKYVGFFRVNYLNRRMIGRSETSNLNSWPDPEILVQSDPNRPVQDDHYTSGFHEYPGTIAPGAPNAPRWSRFCGRGTNEKERAVDFLDRDDEREFNHTRHRVFLMFPSIYHRHRNTVESEMWISRTGKHWHPLPGIITTIEHEGMTYIGHGWWHDSAPGGDDRGNVMLGTGGTRWWFNGVQADHSETKNDDDRKIPWILPLMRYSINHGVKKPAGGKFGSIHSASWNQDRICGIAPRGEGEATFWTPIFHVGSKHVFINARINAGGFLRIGLWDNFMNEAIPGFTPEDMDPIEGDITQEKLVWNGESDVSIFNDVNLRLQVRFMDAMLFSITITSW